MLTAAEMVALAAVRQALYIIVTVFQSARDMGEKVADRPVLWFGGDWRRRGIGAISLAESPSIQSAGFPVIPRESGRHQSPGAAYGITVLRSPPVRPVGPFNLAAEEEV